MKKQQHMNCWYQQNRGGKKCVDDGIGKSSSEGKKRRRVGCKSSDFWWGQRNERDRQRRQRIWKEIDMKEKIKDKKKNTTWKKVGLIFHFSSTNHQGSLTTGLPVGQDCWSGIQTHTHCDSHTDTDTQYWTPSTLCPVSADSVADGENRGHTNEWSHGQTAVHLYVCSSVQRGSQQDTMETQRPLFVTLCVQKVLLELTPSVMPLGAATPAACRSETTHDAAHTELARNTLNAITVCF